MHINNLEFQLENFTFGGPITSFLGIFLIKIKIDIFSYSKTEARTIFRKLKKQILFNNPIEIRSQSFKKDEFIDSIQLITSASLDLSKCLEKQLNKLF